MTVSPRRSLAPSLALLAAAVVACGRPSASDLGKIRKDPVPYARFTEFVERQVGEKAPKLDAAVLSQLLDQFLDERLLVESAVERGLVEPGIDQRAALAALLKAAPLAEPDEAAVARAYAESQRDFSLPERVRLAQILVAERPTAVRALEEIRRGEDFGRVAERYSIDPSASRGGFQGELAASDLPEALADRIFALQAGETSEIIEASYGFHIFRVIERLPARVVPLAEAARSIKNRLREEQAGGFVAGLLDDARQRYTVVIYEQNLPFPYQGRYRTPA